MKAEIEHRDDEFTGEKGHPQCVFFESFPSSPDPYEAFYGVFFCHMSGTEKHAEICKGDYLKCPLAYGRSPFFSELNESNYSGTKQQTRSEGEPVNETELVSREQHQMNILERMKKTREMGKW